MRGNTHDGMAFTLYGGRAWWDRAGVRHATPRATKTYRFNGQVVAQRKNGVLTYLHSDQLGSTALTTNSSGATLTDQGFYAYSRYLRSGELSKENRFTGQKLDGVSLQSCNARPGLKPQANRPSWLKPTGTPRQSGFSGPLRGHAWAISRQFIARRRYCQ